jgi:hypothetical protein
MLKKIYQHQTGQAVAEFGIALLVLLTLIFWMLRLGTLLNLRHKAVESARLVVWEKAYGRDENGITQLVESTIRNGALFSPPSDFEINARISRESSRNDYQALLDVPDGLGLKHDNFYVGDIRVTGDLLFGTDFSLRERFVMLADPWNLNDRNGDRRVDDDDLAHAVNGIYFWIPGAGPLTSGAIGSFLNGFSSLQRSIRNLPLVGFLLRFAGIEIDIDPRGHPTLEAVPKPSGN